MEARTFGQATRIAAFAAVFVALVAIAFISGVSAFQGDDGARSAAEPPRIVVDGSGLAETAKPYRIEVSVEGLDDRDIAEWTVDWGDGTVDTKRKKPGRANHKYERAGSHDILVTVTDVDGNTFLSTDLVVPLYDASRGVRRYDVATGSEIAELGASAASLRAAFGSTVGPDGMLYVTGSSSNTVERFDMADNSHVDTFVDAGAGGLERPTGVALGPDGQLYVASGATGQVLRYDGATGSFIGVFTTTQPLNSPSALVFGPDGDRYVADRGNDTAIFP